MSNTVIYVLIGIAAIAVLYFLFGQEEAIAAPSTAGTAPGLGSVSSNDPIIDMIADVAGGAIDLGDCAKMCRNLTKCTAGKTTCKQKCYNGENVSSIYWGSSRKECKSLWK